MPLALKSSLRYGENPHQKAAFYVDKSLSEVNAGGIATAVQHHGKVSKCPSSSIHLWVEATRNTHLSIVAFLQLFLYANKNPWYKGLILSIMFVPSNFLKTITVILGLMRTWRCLEFMIMIKIYWKSVVALWLIFCA